MGRILTDEDINAIALRVIQLLGTRLSAAEPLHADPLPAPLPQPPDKFLKPKLAYTLKELCDELGVSRVTLYRMEIRGLLKPLPYFRHKIFSRAEVERFLSGERGNTGSLLNSSGRRKRT